MKSLMFGLQAQLNFAEIVHESIVSQCEQP